MKKFHIYSKAESGGQFPLVMHVEADLWELCEGLLVFRDKGPSFRVRMAIPLENVAYFVEEGA